MRNLLQISIMHDQLDIAVVWVARLVLVPERFQSIIKLLVYGAHIRLSWLQTLHTQGLGE